MEWSFTPATGFSSVAGDWDALNAVSANSPLLTGRFVAPLLKYFGRGNETVATLKMENQPVAIGIFQRLKLGRWMTFQPSQAPLGCWLVKPGLDLETVLRSLVRQLPGLTLQVSITQQDPLFVPRPPDVGNLSTLDYIDTASIPVAGTFDDYWSQRSKNLRQGLKRQRNKLEREGIAPQLKTITDPASVPDAVKAYGDLESAGWKAKSGTAIHVNNDQGHFYTELLTNFMELNQGVIYQYLYNDQLVASDLCVCDNESLIILKTTYDESITSTSPAMLMRQEAFKQVFDGALCKKIEFYGKVMDWHTKWSTETRSMYHVNYLPKWVAILKARRPY